MLANMSPLSPAPPQILQIQEPRPPQATLQNGTGGLTVIQASNGSLVREPIYVQTTNFGGGAGLNGDMLANIAAGIWEVGGEAPVAALNVWA